MDKDKFIVIEGGDGSGKATQAKLLIERLGASGIAVATFDFPRYGHPSAYLVEKYLNNGYGPAIDVDPHKASHAYAADRMDASDEIRVAMASGAVPVSNRFTASNMAYQGAKVPDAHDRAEFLRWLLDLEFKRLAIPQPSLNIILRVAPSISFALIEQKAVREYIKDGNRDGHERSIEYQKKVCAMYEEIVGLFPDQFTVIDCMDGEKLLSPEIIHDRVWTVVKAHLEI